LGQRIVDLIRAGNYLEVAATAAGIHRSTLHRWLKYGRARQKGRFKKFVLAVERAQAEAESRDVALIARAATEDWRLERKQPRRYGPRVALSVQQELDSVLERLKKGLEAEAYEKVLELMVAEDVPVPELGNGEDSSDF
jgi:predicted site-specific integrase-resolvase